METNANGKMHVVLRTVVAVLAVLVLVLSVAPVSALAGTMMPQSIVPEKSVTRNGHTFKWSISDEGQLTIKGQVDLGQDANPQNAVNTPWYSYREQIRSVYFFSGTSLHGGMNHLFNSCTNLTNVSGLSGVDTSNVTSMRFMFFNCSNLSALQLFGLDTSGVLDMSYMFYKCSKLKAVFASGLDTSHVTDMQGMFFGCTSLETLNIKDFDTSNVTDMNSMFCDCSALDSLGVSKFDTSKVTDMSYMFEGCTSLKSLDVSKFDTSKVTKMNRMFSECSKLTTLDVSGFDTSKVTNMEGMFYYCTGLKALDVSRFDTSRVTDTSRMFVDCKQLTSLDVSNFRTSNVTNMSWMFTGCSQVTALNVSNFDTSRVTNMDRMFFDCAHLLYLDVSNFDTSSATVMQWMFVDCSRLVVLDISGFDTSGALYSEKMFLRCVDLKVLYLGSGWKGTSADGALSDGWYEDRDGDGAVDAGSTQFAGSQVTARGSNGLMKLRYLKSSLERHKVTYVVYGDPVYGTPADGGMPEPSFAFEYHPPVLSSAPTTSWTTSDGTASGIKGVWSFSGWSGVSEGDIVSSDIVVTGRWTFAATPASSTASPSAAAVEKRILAMKSDKDVAGSAFAILQARASKTGRSSITLKWTKVKGATRYVVYGNRCGKKNRYEKIKTVKAPKRSFKQKGLKAKAYHKYIVVAVGKAGGSEVALATSKTVHAATKGSSKRANPTKVTVRKKKLALKRGKAAKLGAKQAKKRGTKVKSHRKVAYESSDPDVATVSRKGKVTAKKKGTAYVFAYAQNGAFAKVKVSVK